MKAVVLAFPYSGAASKNIRSLLNCRNTGSDAEWSACGRPMVARVRVFSTRCEAAAMDAFLQDD
jgi:hypothetical protein